MRSLGAVYFLAFVSLAVQVPVLLGSHGLLPVRELLAPASETLAPDTTVPDLAAVSGVSFLERPTLFWLGASDGALETAAWAGAGVSALLLFGIAPRLCLVAIWALYLSFVSVGQSFLAFQWDNLLLESALFALALAPPGLRPRGTHSPGPVGVFLVLWLLFRLHFESGLVKLLGGDPAWRDLTAMQSYYETAPLPTPLGWVMHQAPAWVHTGTSAIVLLGELAVPLLLLIPARRARAVAVALLVALQLGIELTANYGFFNILTIVLCLPALDDGHLDWIVGRFRSQSHNSAEPAPTIAHPPRRERRVRTLGLLLIALVAVPLSIVPLLEVLDVRGASDLAPALRPFRSVNAYYLFSHMTLVRKEVVLEGSPDGEAWEPYEFRWKPGRVDRAPPFVAPHQPRVDFFCWFLLLGDRHEEFFQTLVRRIATEPDSVASLFTAMPFSGAAPRFLRVSSWRYRFSDPETRARTGAWWTRQLIGHSPPIETSRFRRR